MTMNEKKKRTGSGLVLIIFGIFLILAGTVPALLLPSDLFEYVLPAPAISADTTAQALTDSLRETLEGFEWSAAFRTQNTEISASATAVRQTVTLYAVGEGYADLHHETLLSGSYITGEDIRNGRKAALINQSCAFSLFPSTDPIGQTLICNGKELEIIGVTKEGFRPGEAADHIIWIPFPLAETKSPGTMTLEIRVRSGSQAKNNILKTLLSQWHTGGTAHDFSRLRLETLMPLWFLGAVAGFQLLKLLTEKTVRVKKDLCRSFRARLETSYPGQLKGALLGTILIGICAAALLLACIYAFLSYLMIPLYTFTDWIPEAFVDPNAVAATVRRLLPGAAVSGQYFSSDSTAYRLYSSWIAAGCLLFSAGVALRFLAKVWKKKP